MDTPNEQVVIVNQRSRFDLAHLIYYALDIVAFFLGLRFIFSIFDASRTNALVDFVYMLTGPLVAPFKGMFPLPEQAIAEWPTLLAMLCYAIIAYILVRVAKALR